MRAIVLAGMGAAAVVLGGCATPYASVRAAEKTQTEAVEESLAGERYVAIGSSFAAGPQLPPAKPGAPARCGQSLNNYPTLLAERFGMVLVDRSCSGAKTEHVLGPWGDIAPQIASVTPETRLVTITIGGNDLNYIGNLFSATCAFSAKSLAASGATVKPCAPVYVPNEADYARDEAQLKEIARRVRQTAPQARLVFVQYLTPLPPEGSLCAVTPVSTADAAIVRGIGRRLTEITRNAAREYGALIVEMNQSSVTHTPCDAVPWMIGAPQGYDGKQGLQWHLNKAGMQATADGIAYWLTTAGVKPVKPGGEEKIPVKEKPFAPAVSPASAPAKPSAAVPDVPEPAPAETAMPET